jgi:disulfide bond formation protein DsbB
VATGATLGSLYFSESAGFVPCELCWFQRIAMYPLAIILGVAVMRRDRTVLPYALTLSVIGLGISAYHVQLQLFPEQSSFCEATNPCSGRWVEAFGWLTIPQMAGLSFALIALLASLAILAPDKDHS